MTEGKNKETIAQPKKKLPIKLILTLIFFLVILPTVILAVIAWKIFFGKVRVKNCRAFTPLSLSELEAATMIKPIYGEKCDLNKDNFLVRLAYIDESQAAQAALGLRLASPGNQRYENYIMDGKTAAAFYSFENKVYLVVMPDIGDSKKAEKYLKKITSKNTLAEFIVPIASNLDLTDAKDEILEKAIEEANKPTPTPTSPPTATPTPKIERSTSVEIVTKAPESPADESTAILAAAQVYVSKNSAPGLQFTLTLKKQVGNYAMVYAEPEPGTADSAGVILEKISGQWVGQTMGTIFPDWEQKAPELFK